MLLSLCFDPCDVMEASSGFNCSHPPEERSWRSVALARAGDGLSARVGHDVTKIRSTPDGIFYSRMAVIYASAYHNRHSSAFQENFGKTPQPAPAACLRRLPATPTRQARRQSDWHFEYPFSLSKRHPRIWSAEAERTTPPKYFYVEQPILLPKIKMA